MTSPSGGRRRPAVPWPLELCLLGPSLAAGIGLARLTNAPGAGRVVAPIVVAVVTGQLVAAAGRRLGGVVSLALGAAAVGLVTIWWFEPSTVWWGLPTASTLHAVGHDLSAAVTVTRSAPTPVAAVPPVVMCVSAGAGLAAVVGRAALGWPAAGARRGPLLWALAPSAGVFAYAALLSSGVDRVQAACAYIATLVIVVIAVDRAGSRRGARGALSGAAVFFVSVAVALGAVLVSAPSLGAALPHVFLSATARTGPGAGGGAEARVADTVALVDDVGSLLSAGGGVVLFTARSDEPTYWQVATLTHFDGRAWLPPPSTWTAVDGLEPAGVAPVPAGPEPTATFGGEVRVAGLRSTLLPVPPGTLAVDGSGAVLDLPVGALRPAGTVDGTVYSFAAASPSQAASGVAGPAPTAAALEPYLELPRQPRSIVRLAHRIVAGARTPFAEAAALARYFDTGRFHYSLAARQDPADPLGSFLFGSRTGFCQQFAGAYAVLARIDGLPTRIGVGFDAGAVQGTNRYVVTTADAHVWPEVYLGPGTGWVSFEPTPPTGTGTAIAAGVVYGTAIGPGPRQGGSGATVTTNPRERAGSGATATSSPGSVPAARPGARASGRGPGGADRRTSWVLGVLVALAVAALVLGRERISDAAVAVRTTTLPPGPAVALHWRRAARAFERRAGRRGPAETITEHAARMASRFPAAGDPYGVLTGLASRASYSGETVSGDDVARARALCAQTRHALRRRRHPPRHGRRHEPSRAVPRAGG